MNQENLKDKRIAVVGAGGVGGYLGAMLARTYGHVTLVVRGRRMESIRENGLVLHSDYKGEIAARPERAVPIDQMGEQDIILVCVKNYSLEEACRDIQDFVTEDTIIVPVMNGVDPAERIAAALGKGTVVSSLIYIVAFANEDFSVTQQGDFASLRIGIENAAPGQQEKVELVSAILSGADIDHKIAKDIELEIWRKYILNCAYNVATAYYDNTIGELRSDPAKAKEYEDLVWEAYKVGVSKGVRLTEDHASAIIHRFHHELADDATSSLQRDVRAGKPAEVETFCGYIVKEARKRSIDVPVTEKMYEGLSGTGR